MSRNVKDWARSILSKLGEEDRGPIEVYLSGNETFAECAITLIERFADKDVGADEKVDDLNEKLERILNRVNSGEDAEAVVREEIQPS